MDLQSLKFATICKNGDDKNRIYKLKDEKELIEVKEAFKKYFKNSVTILSFGKFSDGHRKHVEAIANDYAYMDLKLVNNDLFVITRESICRHTDEDRMNRIIQKGGKISKITKSKKTKLRKINPINKRLYGWSGEQIGYLWDGTPEQVADKLGKNVQSVYRERRKYLKENKNFIVANTKVDTPLTPDEVLVLWSHSSKILKKDLIKSYREIHNLRYKYCLENPSFVIPLVAEFNPSGLINAVEPKPIKVKKEKIESNSWTNDAIDLLWLGNGQAVAETIGKTYQAVYHKRIAYCMTNPTFVIPLVAEFKVPSKCINSVEISPEIVAAISIHDRAEDTRNEVVEVSPEVENAVKELLEVVPEKQIWLKKA